MLAKLALRNLQFLMLGTFLTTLYSDILEIHSQLM